MATIPLIDDEEQVRLILQVALAGPGYLVLAADDGQHGLRLFQRQEVDLILVDIFMPEPDGLDLIPRLDSTRPPARLLQNQAALGGDYLDKARHLGANDTLKKPFSLQELLAAASTQLN